MLLLVHYLIICYVVGIKKVVYFGINPIGAMLVFAGSKREGTGEVVVQQLFFSRLPKKI